MRAHGWVIMRSGKREVIPEPMLIKEKIFWPLKMQEVKPGQSYPDNDQDEYWRHQLEGHNIFIYLLPEMNLENVPEETIAEILGES